MGFAIEPPCLFLEAIPTDDSGGLKPAPLLESDTAGILRLCAQARRSERPARDQLVAQLHSLDCDLCEDQAVEAIELLIYDLIVIEARSAVQILTCPKGFKRAEGSTSSSTIKRFSPASHCRNAGRSIHRIWLFTRKCASRSAFPPA